MYAALEFQLDGRDPVEVDVRLGDVSAWERWSDRAVSQLEEEPRLCDMAWLAWRAWQRQPGAKPTPWERFEQLLVEVKGAQPATPGEPASSDTSAASSP